MLLNRTEINRKMPNTIWLRFDLRWFRKYFCVISGVFFVYIFFLLVYTTSASSRQAACWQCFEPIYKLVVWMLMNLYRDPPTWVRQTCKLRSRYAPDKWCIRLNTFDGPFAHQKKLCSSLFCKTSGVPLNFSNFRTPEEAGAIKIEVLLSKFG